MSLCQLNSHSQIRGPTEGNLLFKHWNPEVHAPCHYPCYLLNWWHFFPATLVLHAVFVVVFLLLKPEVGRPRTGACRLRAL